MFPQEQFLYDRILERPPVETATAPKRCLDGTEPEKNSRGGRASRESSGRLADVGKISTGIVNV